MFFKDKSNTPSMMKLSVFGERMGLNKEFEESYGYLCTPYIRNIYDSVKNGGMSTENNMVFRQDEMSVSRRCFVRFVQSSSDKTVITLNPQGTDRIPCQ